MPKLFYISSLSPSSLRWLPAFFHHHNFCGYLSCIFAPNLRILVPDRIVRRNQAHLALFPFSTYSTIWKSMYLFFSPFSFLGAPVGLLEFMWGGVTCLIVGHSLTPLCSSACFPLSSRVWDMAPFLHAAIHICFV